MMTKWTESQLNAVYLSGTNIIVSAGAGSGKTAVLTTRVIEKLKKGININQLLVLTFTKAAANEMKERIRAALIKEGLQDQLLLLDSSYITTFDSYAYSLVKKYHYLLNISKDISISPDSLIDVVIDETIEAIFHEGYEKEDSSFLKLVSDFCVKDDANLKKAIISLYHKLNQKVDKVTFLNNYFATLGSEETIKENVSKYTTIIKDKIETLEPLFKNLLSEANSECYEEIMALYTHLLHATSYEEMKGIINQANLPRKKRDCGENYSSCRQDLMKELNKLSELVRFNDEEAMADDVKKTIIYQKALIDIILKLDAKVEDYKHKHQLFTFYDVAKMAINLIKLYPQLQAETKASFKEIMIDEYQDTSDIQEAFIELIANHNVYMVGDIKQSIYRFRNANPTLFKTKYALYDDVGVMKPRHGIKIDLLENFRSRREVLQAINEIFDFVMSEEIGGADYRHRHRMLFGNKAYEENKDEKFNYQIEVLNYCDLDESFKKTEREAFAIAYDIKSKVDKIMVFDKNTKGLRKAIYSDFAILMDRGTEFDTYKKIFEYLGLPISIYKDENLNDGYDLGLMKNILKFIFKLNRKEYDVEYRYLFTSIARSFLFNIKDEEIYDHLQKQTIAQSPVYQKAFAISQKLTSLNCLELIQTIIDDFAYLKQAQMVGNIDVIWQKLDYLLSLAQDLTKAGLTTLDFITHLERVIDDGLEIKYSVNIGEDDAIKLMNIHKSKGLEFPICYYAGLSTPFNISDVNGQFIFDNTLGFICPYFENGIKETIYKDIYKYYYNYEEISERIRLFYVALTRAKEKIIIVDNLDTFSEAEICESKKLRYRSFKNILDSVYQYLHFTENKVDVHVCQVTDKYKMVKATNYQDTLNSGTFLETIDITKFINYQMAVPKEHYSKHITKFITKEEMNKMEFGTKLHYYLETLDFKSSSLMDDIRNLEIEALYQEKLMSLAKILLTRNLEEAKIYQEFEFIDNDKQGIIDLMLEYNDHIDIIDYKLKNIDDEAYHVQLQGYKDYIAKRTHKPVNTYLYSLLEEKLEKV